MTKNVNTKITLGLLEAGAALGDKYVVEEVIGVGGMGAVYRARHSEIDRHVAIKRLHPHLSTAPGVIERFQQEARAAGSIGHDNICEVTDRGNDAAGTPYLVMPLLTGSSLGDLLNDERVSFKRLADIVGQTLSALEAAHDARIVHRDLKPDNIFITKLGDREDFVKLLDFGISKLLSSKSAKELTHTGVAMGTPFYMAPEQARGAKWIDHRADLYAIGVILYEACTGRRPFRGDSWNEVMFNIISSRFDAPSQINPDIPQELDGFILRAMAREADKRFASAAEMRRALEQLGTHYPADLRTPEPGTLRRQDSNTNAAEPAPRNDEALESNSPVTATAVGYSSLGFEGRSNSSDAPRRTPEHLGRRNNKGVYKYAAFASITVLIAALLTWALFPQDDATDTSLGDGASTSAPAASSSPEPAVSAVAHSTGQSSAEVEDNSGEPSTAANESGPGGPIPGTAPDNGPAAQTNTPEASGAPRRPSKKRARRSREVRGRKGTTFFVDY